MRCAFCFVVVAVFCATVAAPAAAHTVGLSRSAWVVSDDGAVDVEFTFARGDGLALLPGADGDADGALSAAELEQAAVGALWQKVRVTRGDDACDVVNGAAALVEEDGVVFGGSAACRGHGALAADLSALLAPLGAAHRHLGRVSSGGTDVDVVAFSARPSFTLAPEAAGVPVADYLGLGVEHIVFGYDHLCFLVGLIVVVVRGGRLRSLVGVITAFTLAHSITLGLAATGAVVPPSSFIEPLIAASIVFVGVESWFLSSPAGRWRLTLPFGLVHGFGFAGALAEIGLPQDAAVPALALFNLGVELGQLGVLLLLAPLLLLVRRKLDERQRVVVVRAVSVAVAVAGAAWLAERLLG